MKRCEHRNWRKCSGGAEGRGWSGEQWGRLKHQGNIVSWHAALTNFFMAFFSNCEMLTGRLALLHRLALWSARHTADCGESVQKCDKNSSGSGPARHWAPCTGLLQGEIEGEDLAGVAISRICT